jgi:cytochrome c oxidase assembly protein Cox11
MGLGVRPGHELVERENQDFCQKTTCFCFSRSQLQHGKRCNTGMEMYVS